MIESISTKRVWRFPSLAKKLVNHLVEHLPGRIVGVCGEFAVIAVGPIHIELSRRALASIGVAVAVPHEFDPSAARRLVELNIGADYAFGRVTLSESWFTNLQGEAIPFTAPTVARIQATAPRLVFEPAGVGVRCRANDEYEQLVLDDIPDLASRSSGGILTD